MSQVNFWRNQQPSSLSQPGANNEGSHTRTTQGTEEIHNDTDDEQEERSDSGKESASVSTGSGEDPARANSDSDAGGQNNYDYLRVWKAEVLATIPADPGLGLQSDDVEYEMMERIHEFEEKYKLKTRSDRNIVFANNISDENYTTEDLHDGESPSH
ncbi:hypothetical protein CPC08DRAFT_549607 [Agrocybe pediades]|nr:hypothetical protein CPC08DRAFT_549607 [Agrocybe pediades]